MKRNQQKMGRVSQFIGMLSLMIAGILYFTPFPLEQKMDVWTFALPLGLVSFLFGNYYMKQASAHIQEEYGPFDIESLSELIFIPKTQWTREWLNVDADGRILFTIRVAGSTSSKGLRSFSDAAQRGLFVPVTYEIVDETGVVAAFRMSQNVKRAEVEIFDTEGELLGTYDERIMDSLLKKQGQLICREEVLAEVKEKSAAGDIDLRKPDGTFIAQHRYGRFKHAMKPAFEAYSEVYYVTLNEALTAEEKWCTIALFSSFYIRSAK